jgi:hypothetical protein
LHIPVGVRCSGEIASPDCYQARNDGKEVVARNDAPFVIARSEATKQSLTAVRHCEPKGWQVCWREAISPLHIPFSVKCFEEIASLTSFARNDGVGLQASNDVRGLFEVGINIMLIAVVFKFCFKDLFYFTSIKK